MYPETTELRLMGNVTESTWTPQIQIKYVDTKNQLADTLTKGNITRDEIIFSICSMSAFSAQPAQTLNLVSHAAASSSTAPSSSASNRPGIFSAFSQQGSNVTAKGAGKPAAGSSNQNYAASSSQVWLTDAKMNGRARKLAAAGANRGLSF